MNAAWEKWVEGFNSDLVIRETAKPGDEAYAKALRNAPVYRRLKLDQRLAVVVKSAVLEVMGTDDSCALHRKQTLERLLKEIGVYEVREDEYSFSRSFLGRHTNKVATVPTYGDNDLNWLSNALAAAKKPYGLLDIVQLVVDCGVEDSAIGDDELSSVLSNTLPTLTAAVVVSLVMDDDRGYRAAEAATRDYQDKKFPSLRAALRSQTNPVIQKYLLEEEEEAWTHYKYTNWFVPTSVENAEMPSWRKLGNSVLGETISEPHALNLACWATR